MISERTLHIATAPNFGLDMLALFLRPAPKDPDEMYLCGECKTLLDRNVPSAMLTRSLIVCPVCNSINQV